MSRLSRPTITSRRCPLFGLAMLLVALAPAVLNAQESGGPVGSQERPLPAVVARVNGQPIYRAEVDRAIAAALRGQQVDPRQLPLLRASALAELIDARLVQDYINRAQLGASREEVDVALAELKARLKEQSVDFQQFLAQTNHTEISLRRQLEWQVGWGKYLRQRITEGTLETAFQRYRRQLDGTQLRVSHILLRPVQAGEGTSLEQEIRKAEAIRREILAGRITFAEAAARDSSGPSRRQGGDLGYIPRHGLMVEAFADAAFRLKVGEISPPVVTSFGVHLITVTDEKPGEKTLAEVRDQLQPLLAQQLLEDLVRKQREEARVEFAEGFPHFKLGTRDLVLPDPSTP
jgi:parvulin-like peptidyl-prolyl isomerase